MTEPPADQPRTIRRHSVVNRLLSLYDAPRYLEIGVCAGWTFDRVRADAKVAIDPAFRFDHEDPARVVAGVEYHAVKSDDYFGSIVEPDRQFDVIFLDGLHTVEQTLRDLNNALHHLQPRGVIVIDDVRPPTHLASIPDRERFFEVRRRLGLSDQAWMGDVYRLVLCIETFYQQLRYRTVENNHGQAVVWRKRRAEVVERGLASVGAWEFEDLLLHEETLRLAPFRQIMREVRRDLGVVDEPGGGQGSD